jgi:hypothetical protein
MDLAEVHKRCLEEIRAGMVFLSAGYPMRECGEKIEELSALFQGLGICHLLESLSTIDFQENLVRSGQARRYFLHMSQLQGNTVSKHLALSRSEAFLDALAAGNLKLANSIAELSPKDWNPNWEYEDDFCFYLFLQQLLLQVPQNELQHTVKRFEVASEGGTSPRLRVLTALRMEDAREFESALSALLWEEQNRAHAQRSGAFDSKFLFWPRSFVSIEGLALLRAAELVGISIEGEFTLCPSEARLSVGENDYRDFFAELAGLLSG